MQLLHTKKYLSRRSGNLWVDNLEKAITRRVGSSLTLHFYKLENEDQAAQLLLQEVIYYLERRVPFRRLKAVLLQELGSNYTEGVRVVCSGRVGGRSKKAQRARKEGVPVGADLVSRVFLQVIFRQRKWSYPLWKDWDQGVDLLQTVTSSLGK